MGGWGVGAERVSAERVSEWRVNGPIARSAEGRVFGPAPTPPRRKREGGGSSARRGGATRYPSAVVRCSIHRVVLVVYGVNMIDNTRRHQVRLVHVDLYCYLLLLLAIGLLVPLPC